MTSTETINYFFDGELHVDLLRRVFTQAIYKRVGKKYQLRFHSPIKGGEKAKAQMAIWWSDSKKVNRGAHERSYASIGHLMLYEKEILAPDVYESLLKYWHKAVGPSLTPERAIELRIGITPGTTQYVFSNKWSMPHYDDVGVAGVTNCKVETQVPSKHRIRWRSSN